MLWFCMWPLNLYSGNDAIGSRRWKGGQDPSTVLQFTLPWTRKDSRTRSTQSHNMITTLDQMGWLLVSTNITVCHLHTSLATAVSKVMQRNLIDTFPAFTFGSASSTELPQERVYYFPAQCVCFSSSCTQKADTAGQFTQLTDSRKDCSPDDTFSDRPTPNCIYTGRLGQRGSTEPLIDCTVALASKCNVCCYGHGTIAI